MTALLQADSSFSMTGSQQWAELLTRVLNVKDYGAIGDWNGSSGTDNTTAIQTALNTGAPEVYVPSGRYKTTAKLKIQPNQTLRGSAQSLVAPTTPIGSSIVFRPSSDKVAITTSYSASNTKGECLKSISLELNDATHTGIQFAHSYGNVLEDIMFFGTCNIGAILHDTYVIDIRRFVVDGAFIKSFGLAIGDSNAVSIDKFHISSLPQDAATAMHGIAMLGNYSVASLRNCVLQGCTVGIAAGGGGGPLNIYDPYFENTVCNIRSGSPSATTGPDLNIFGGTYSPPYNSHPQYASRGPVIYLRRGAFTSIKGAGFSAASDATQSTGPWFVLLGGVDRLTMEQSGFSTSTMKISIVQEFGGANCGITLLGDKYGSNGAQGIVLKKDGAFGTTCYEIQVDVSGNVVTAAYTPAIAVAATASLLTGELPSAASLLV